jgi:hypothetical protein
LRKKENLLAAEWGRPQESLVLYKSSILSAIIPLAACAFHLAYNSPFYSTLQSQVAYDPASHIASETDFFPASIPAYEKMM